nr:peptidoglycan bridge formation glycyltransferase FemA/FemB family protein [Treponemataceae bacterium]
MFSFQIEKVEKQDFDSYKSEHYLQTDFWAEFKSMHGWKKMLYKVLAKDDSAEFDFYASILVRRFAKIFHIAYVPLGLWLGQTLPNDKISDQQYFNLLTDFSKAIKKELPKNTILIRFDPPYEFYDPDARDQAVKELFTGKNAKFKALKKNAVDIQPPDTTILDLTKSEDDLLSAMKSKWRYNIHLAEKKGVRVEKGTSKDIDVFYNLYLATSKRDGIAIHSKKYYSDLLELSEKMQKEDPKSNPLFTL